MTNSLASTFTIGDIVVRQLDGLFSINDLHAASGAARRHEPGRFTRLANTQELVKELGAYPELGTPLKVINDGENNGTYACREVVIAYAAWISAVFHLKVIRVFLNAIAPAPTLTITPAQAQHLRELVQLVVETGKQSHGETWTRLHRKMKTNSYLALRPDQFDAACEYLRGKFDGESIAAIAQKHFPQIAQLSAPTPEPKPMPPKVPPEMLIGLISGGCLSEAVVRDIAMAANNYLYRNACMSPSGYGEEVAKKITHDLPLADLHAIVVRATMEMTLRVHGYDIAQQGAAA